MPQETKLGFPLNYSPDVAAYLSQMDEEHATTQDESIMGYGLVEMINETPTVVDLIATLENQLIVPSNFPRDITTLLACYREISLTIEPAKLDFGKLMLTGTQPDEELGLHHSKSINLAFIKADGNFDWEKWDDIDYPPALSFLLENFFSIKNQDLMTFLTSLLAKANLDQKQSASITTEHSFDIIASDSSAFPTLNFNRKLKEMVTKRGYTSETAQMFATHYHPFKFIENDDIQRLLRFSSPDIRSFMASLIAYYQTRTVRNLDKLETISLTSDRKTLDKYFEPIHLINSLVQQTEKDTLPMSAKEVIHIIQEYLQSLPNSETNGLHYDQVFHAGKLFYTKVVEDMPKSWTRTVMSRDQFIREMREKIFNTGLYRDNLANLGLYHLNSLHGKPPDEQQQVDFSFLTFMEETTIFATIAALVWSWVEAEDIDYRQELTDIKLPKLFDLAATPFETDIEKIKKIVTPYLETLLSKRKDILERHCQNFEVDLDKIKKLFEVK